MRKHTYVDTVARRVFEGRIRGVRPETLKLVLDGKNPVGWMRSVQIRSAWRILLSCFSSDNEETLKAQYCP